MQALKLQVHSLTNKLQAIMGYLELEQYHKALAATRDAVREIQHLAKMLTGYIAVSATDTVIVAPPAVPVVSPEDVAIKIPGEKAIVLPANVVAIVPKENIKTKK